MPLVTRGLGAFNTGASVQVDSQPPFEGTAVVPDLKVSAITIPDLQAVSVVELDA